jgi:hypothetical protein
MKTMTGNLSHNKELQNLISRYSDVNIPTEISVNNSHCFNFLGFNVKKGNGLSLSLRVRQFTKTVELWEAMTDYQKRPEIIGAFESVIMLHNPYNEPEEIEFEEITTDGRMTKAKKTKINKMMENGEGTDDDGLNEIAENLGLSFRQVKDYIMLF